MESDRGNITGPIVYVQILYDLAGAVSSIDFKSADGSFGKLSNAKVFSPQTAPEDQVFPNGKAISIKMADIPEVLLGLLHNQSELASIADFRPFPRDPAGVPMVLRHTLSCEACGHQWTAQLAEEQWKFICPRCKSIVETVGPAIVWVGPQSASLKAVWRDLPRPGSRIADVGDLTIDAMEDGICVLDPLGNRVVIHVERNGISVHLFAGGGDTPTSSSYKVAQGIIAPIPASETP
ncbi:hypothetical protein D2T29_12595 [Sinirhodobacter populi]|uniref:Uncharacterized protein n=1 Tax=Paenirhodobacter populi TaxID=2306993 RepID=A0A443KD28_9RHOB|nr:hypothetical protein [Sinirhodobacter populi]RWR30503.1 hypothetical protein D2T29_12595 [Sinirhodobacter populi]